MQCLSSSLKGWCKEVATMMTRYFVGGDLNKKKIHWRKWKDLTKPKKNVGLGFRDLETFSDAMLGKMVGKIVTNLEALWV